MMDKEKVIQMARDAGDCLKDKRGREDFIFDSYGIERFAAAIRSATKEEDAKICDVEAVFAGSSGKKDASAANCATAIRASK